MAENNRLEGSKIMSLPRSAGEKVNDFFIKSYRKVDSSRVVYYTWLSRFFIFTSVVSLLFMVSTSLSIFNLSPKVSVEPFLIVNQDRSKGIIRNEAISANMASKNQLMETFVKQYIILRNTIINDEREMETRWYGGGVLNFYSSPAVFSAFSEYREEIWHTILKANISREVEIISINKVGGDKSPIWKVDFKTYDISDKQRSGRTKAILLTTRYWTSSVTAYFVPERRFVGARLINPLGFTVVRYSQTEVEGM